jgi:hypothetical protein
MYITLLLLLGMAGMGLLALIAGVVGWLIVRQKSSTK